MTSAFTYGTVSGSSYGMALTPKEAESKPKTPAGLIVTQAVQTRDGWLGQVIVDKTIVWESEPESGGDDAVQAANTMVVQAIRWLIEQAAAAPVRAMAQAARARAEERLAEASADGD